MTMIEKAAVIDWKYGNVLMIICTWSTPCHITNSMMIVISIQTLIFMNIRFWGAEHHLRKFCSWAILQDLLKARVNENPHIHRCSLPWSNITSEKQKWNWATYLFKFASLCILSDSIIIVIITIVDKPIGEYTGKNLCNNTGAEVLQRDGYFQWVVEWYGASHNITSIILLWKSVLGFTMTIALWNSI